MISSFIDYLHIERRYSPHTLTAYRGDLESFESFIKVDDSELDIQDASTIHIRTWVVHLLEQDHASRTVQRKISSLKGFFKYLRKIGYRKDNPVRVITGPKIPRRLPVTVEKEGMADLFNMEEVFPEDLSGLRDRAMLTLFYSTGMRLAEVITSKHSDISYMDMTLRVIGKRDKERIVPLSGPSIEAIKTYLMARDSAGIISELLFLTDNGEPLYPKFVYRKVNHYLGRVSSLSKRSPHVLRHTFATHLLENGAELQSIKEILGHANLAATQVYTHNSIERLKKIHGQAHPKG
jgi:integrase/recombinase XerC